jgi:hypothetical protein
MIVGSVLAMVVVDMAGWGGRVVSVAVSGSDRVLSLRRHVGMVMIVGHSILPSIDLFPSPYRGQCSLAQDIYRRAGRSRFARSVPPRGSRHLQPQSIAVPSGAANALQC